MVKKVVVGLVIMIGFVIGLGQEVLALTPIENKGTNGYIIHSLTSDIKLNQDSSLDITETIEAEFFTNKHGIFRIIPYKYSANGKTIVARLKVDSVTTKGGQAVPYVVDNYNKSKRLKIGDENKTTKGKVTYVIRYQIDDVILMQKDGPEVYWNVAGGEWDTVIEEVGARIQSEYGQIEKVNCYGGLTNGNNDSFCQSKLENKVASYKSTIPLGFNKDLTIAATIAKDNKLVFPNIFLKTYKAVGDNWGYLLAFFPSLLMFVWWLSKGRDKQYTSGNIYYKPEVTREKSVPLLSRPHLPLVYGPVDYLTPAEVGTIADESVDLKDIVGELTELARLGFLTIERIEVKKILRTDKDYKIKSTQKNAATLPEHQSYLLESIFESKVKSINKKQVDGQVTENESVVYQGEVLLSDLKDKFYVHLEPFRRRVYESLVKKNAIPEDPRKVKERYLGKTIGINFLCLIGIFIFGGDTDNYVPIIPWLTGIVPCLVLANAMPKRTAWGYSLYRQTVGLRYYLNVGKWRQEIAEKNLFFQEVLPLAISLGVVSQLSKDMAGLEISSPSYLEGNWTNFGREMEYFSQRSFNVLSSSPTESNYSSSRSGWSGKSSWSGGSGFSGGHSGGGFGGGGGGSW